MILCCGLSSGIMNYGVFVFGVFMYSIQLE
jgi:hypothetical protein